MATRRISDIIHGSQNLPCFLFIDISLVGINQNFDHKDILSSLQFKAWFMEYYNHKGMRELRLCNQCNKIAIIIYTALYYYRARTYDPKVGRFLQQDPIRPRWWDMNRYVYVMNDPVNWSDPEGLVRVPGAGKIIGWGLKKLAKKIGGKIGEKIGEAGGFFEPKLGYPPEQQEMDRDTDGDGQNDFYDTDDDGDGVPDAVDSDPNDHDLGDLPSCHNDDGPSLWQR